MKQTDLKRSLKQSVGQGLLAALCGVVCLNTSIVEIDAAINNTTSISRGKTTYHWQDDERSLKIEMEGDVTFSESDTDFERISPEGTVTIDHKEDSIRRELQLTPRPDGTIERTYRVNRKSQPWNDEGKAWLAKLLPEVIRETGMGANARVERIYKKSGVEGVLQEISQIKSNGVKKNYFSILLKTPALPESSLARIIKQAGDEIRSDGDKSSLLRRHFEQYLKNEQHTAAFFETVQTIRSSGDRRHVLSSILDSRPQNISVLTAIVESAEQIKSDGDKASVLIEASKVPSKEPGYYKAILKAARTIRSSGDHQRVLSRLLQEENLSKEVTVLAIQSASSIDSDGDKANVLVKAIEAVSPNDDVYQAVLESSDTIHSSGDRRRVLSAMLKSGELSTPVQLQFLKSAARIRSDGDKSALLAKAAEKFSKEDVVCNALLEATTSIRSDGDKSRVLATLLERNDLSPAVLENVKETARSEIRSSGDRDRVVKLIEKHPSRVER